MTKGYRVFSYNKERKKWEGQAFAFPTMNEAKEHAKKYEEDYGERTKIEVSTRIRVLDHSLTYPKRR